MKTNKVSLEKKTKRARELMASLRSGTIEIAEIILDARDEDFEGRGYDWVEWARGELGFSRRHTFRMARVAQMVRAAERGGIDVSATCGTDTAKLDILAELEVSSLVRFLESHGVANMDRDELRAAVAAFLGKAAEGRPAQLDFFSSLKLPDPVKFNALLTSNLGRVNAGQAVDYGSALLNAAISKGGLSKAEQDNLEANLWHFLTLTTGKDYHAVVRSLNF